MKTCCLLLLSLLLGYTYAYGQKHAADLIIHNARIYLMDAKGTRAEAIAIENGSIQAVGSNKQIRNRYAAKREIDARGKTVFPGFIDAHCHFTGYALDGYKLDLVGTRSFEEVLKKLDVYEQQNTLGWVYGRGWDQNDWPKAEYPDNTELNKRFPDKPVILKRVDGHAILANQKALELAGITKQTRVAGGIIEQKNGRLTGILIDNAMEAVERIIPRMPDTSALQFLKNMQSRCYAAGLTYVVDCGLSSYQLQLLEQAYNQKQLSIGLTALLAHDSATFAQYLQAGPQHYGPLHITGIKAYADGALGSRGACLLHDYTDQPGYRGLLLQSRVQMDSLCQLAGRYNWQLGTHAIGDSANRMVLQAYEAYLKGSNDRRWRIEHAQVLDPQDFDFFGRNQIVPSVQPTHAISDMPWAASRLGPKRMKTAYAYRQLLEQNGWIALGTDFPVEAINPLATLHTAVARQDAHGNPQSGFQKENALSREQALLGMTLWAARSVFMEANKGSLEAGKDADLILLDTDLMQCRAADILKAKVLMTITGGQIVFESGL